MRTIDVQIPGHSYEIHIGNGARSLLRSEGLALDRCETVVVITDETVGDLHLPALTGCLPGKICTCTVAAGEQSKSLATAESIYSQLADARVERNDVIVAFGGGVVGDLAGFVAATWMRGIRFIQVPTTLEAVIDASVGGKTGLNLPAGKNLVGAFHQPIAVIVDTDFLVTLPERDYRAGLAESVKHAAIRDPAFLDWQEANVSAIVGRQADILEELIARNCRIKADVVAADEREAGLRAILNHGHTVGHAVEHLCQYALRHGECVALGILVENEIAVRRGILAQEAADRIAALIASLGLPTHMPATLDAAAVPPLCRLDKKVRGGAVVFVLLKRIGDTTMVHDVSDAEIQTAMAVIQPHAGK